jgi:glycosyltransferase involved in cell wall biosynthesis
MKRDAMKTAAVELPTTEVSPAQGHTDGARRASVSVIIPTLNEAGNLPFVLDTFPDWVDEIILVDGLSTDDTERIARLLRPGVKVVHELTKGKGAALKAGLKAASGEYLIALDADGAMDGSRIGDFCAAMDRGADYVKGSRFAPGGGSADITRIRRFGDWGICMLIRVLFGAKFSDDSYGYFAVRASRADDLRIDTDGFEVETLINIRAHRAGLAIAEVPCFEGNRIHGASNLSAVKDGIRIARLILRERIGGHRGA